MPEKVEYLRHVAANPQTSIVEAAERFKPTKPSAVEQAYRRYQQQGLVQADGVDPARLSLTDKGRQELLLIEQGRANGASASSRPTANQPVNTPADLLPMLAQVLQEAVNRLAVNGSSESGSVEVAPELEALLEHVEELETEKEQLEEEMNELRASLPRPEVFELYAIELGLRYFPKSERQSRRDLLVQRMDAETAAEVARLADLEEKLCQERGSWLGSKEDAAQIESEIALLREKLGFPVEIETEEGAEEAAGTEEDANGERPRKHGAWL